MPLRAWSFVAALGLLGCSDPAPPPGQGGASWGDETEHGDSTTAVPPPRSSDSTTSDGGEDDGASFITVDGGGGVTYECDLFEQDCEDDEKCMPWANDGGSSWNASRCSGVAPEPDAIGEACTADGSGISGLDSCDFGAVCFYVDPANNEGVCVPMCQGDEETPLCDDPGSVCTGSNDRALRLCVAQCEPLGDDCPDAQTCVLDPSHGYWWCAPALLEPAADGGPCEFINACGPGLQCVSSGLVESCEGATRCCAPLCDVTAPEGCPADRPLCHTAYPRGDAPLGYEDVGTCSAVAEPEHGPPPPDLLNPTLP